MHDPGREYPARVAVVTGGSRGLGAEITKALAAASWAVILDARNAAELADSRRAAVAAAGRSASVIAIAGDIREAAHRWALGGAARALGGVDALICNAAQLGVTPRPTMLGYPLGDLNELFHTNAVAQLALVQDLAPVLRPDAAIVAVTSDAAVESYPGWGGYGAAKAALERLFAVLAVELGPTHRVYLFDPGDLRTAMHQQAFPGEDIGDRPDPSTVSPAVLRLLKHRPASGRYRAADLLARSVR